MEHSDVVLSFRIHSRLHGCFFGHLGSLPIDTIIRVYSVDINKAVAQGLLNGCIPIGALVGAVSSAFIIQRFSRK
jgi:hypothetical protein